MGPLAVISTVRTTKPVRSTPKIALSMSSSVKRSGFWSFFWRRRFVFTRGHGLNMPSLTVFRKSPWLRSSASRHSYCGHPLNSTQAKYQLAAERFFKFVRSGHICETPSSYAAPVRTMCLLTYCSSCRGLASASTTSCIWVPKAALMLCSDVRFTPRKRTIRSAVGLCGERCGA